MKIILFFAFFSFSFFSFCQTNEYEFQYTKYSAFRIKGDSSFVLSQFDTIYVGTRDTILISKENFISLFPDCKELIFVLTYNFTPTIDYARNTTACYNAYKNTNFDPNKISTYEYFVQTGHGFAPKNSFFQKFSLITVASALYGPPAASLLKPQPINAFISEASFTEYNSTGQTSNHGESMKFKFKYGNSPVYKKGLYFTNLYRAFGDDLVAKSYIKKYRRRMTLRLSITFTGYAMLLIAANEFSNTVNLPIKKLNEDNAMILGIPGVFMANIPLVWSKNNLKRKFAVPAIEQYNANLKAPLMTY